MSLSRKIAAAVGELVRSDAPPTAVMAVEGPHRLTLSVALATAVGVSCDGLVFATEAGPAGPETAGGWSLEALKAWGDRLAARVTYLMEPLTLHEADDADGTVLLRSKTPSRRDLRRSYYEVRLDRSGTLRLGRVQFDEAARRPGPAPCHFTLEVLERLADDLVASVEAP